DIQGGRDRPELVVVNKADLAEPETLHRLRTREPDAIAVSARTGAGIEELRARIAETLPRPAGEVDVLVPYDRGDLVHRAHTTGEVIATEHLAEGTRLVARVDDALAAELRRAG